MLSRMGMGLGLGLSRPAAPDPGGGDPGSPYVAQAVHLDGSTFLSTESLTAFGDDTGFCSYSYWFKIPLASYAAGKVVWVVDPAGSYSSNSYVDRFTNNWGFVENQFCNAADDQCWEADATSVLASGQAVPIDGNWHHIAVAVETNHATGTKVFRLFLDGQAMTYNTSERGGAAFTLTFNGQPFYIFTDKNAILAGDFADFWFAPGQFVDWSVPGNLAKVIAAGKPVDLGANGELVTGTAPAIFFSGDHTGFATNKGTGGAFTLTGTLTDASTAP